MLLSFAEAIITATTTITPVALPACSHNAGIYISVCLTQTVVAMAIAYSGDSLVGLLTKNSKDAWSTDKILTVFAGSMLALYSIKLTYEYIQEMNEEGESSEEVSETANRYDKVAADDAGDEEAQKELALMGGEPIGDDESSTNDGEVHQRRKDDTSRTQTLFVIAFLGSVDDLTLFVPMLVGKGFDIVQLVIGGFIAASAIVMLCVFLGLCKPVADCLSRVPLAAIVIVFACTLLIKGFMMD